MANHIAAPARPRREYIDALKGLGIVLVVSGHFMEYYRGTSPVFNGAFECIYVFHMSLLCLCSGMVAKFSPFKLICQQVWLYLVSQSVMLWFRLHVLAEEIAPDLLLQEWLVPWRHMWYLYGLIFWELTVPLLRLARQKGWPGAVLTAVMAAAAVGVGLWGGTRTWGYGFDRVFASFPMFALGVLLSPAFDALDRLARGRWWLRLLAGAAFLAVYLPWYRSVLTAPEIVYEGDRIFNAGMYAGNYTARTRLAIYALGLLTTAALLLAVGGSRWLASLGKRTLPIYILHMLMYAYLSQIRIFEQPNAFGPPAVAVWVVLASGGCVCFFGSAPVCTAFTALANVWYKGVPALVRRAKERLGK